VVRFQRLVILLLIVSVVVDPVFLPIVQAEEPTDIVDRPWPREIEENGVKLVIYQPQPEIFEDNRLRARAAISVTPKGEEEPRFGAIWFEVRVKTDRDERLVAIEDIQVADIRFPTAPEDKVEKLRAYVSTLMPKWEGAQLSLDRLLTSLETAEVKIEAAKNLSTDPPKIVFVTVPTELVIIDGEPELRPVENSPLMKVLNSIYTIVLEPKSKAWFVNFGPLWMTAPDMKGPWTEAKNPPKDVAALTPKPDPEEEAEEDEGIIPAVMVVNEPMELIISDGDPKYQVLPDKDLLFMSNTDGTVFRELVSQDLYALVSGRWFTSKALTGPWKYVAPDKLPESFGKIPAESDVGDARAFVAGTEEAKDAVMDAQIPQTQTVQRDATITVTYDGEPKFEPIKETSMQYAVNTADSVILARQDGKPVYYCCREGVWYVSGTPAGPYAVSTEAPPEINEVPAENPVYNTKYVTVYSSTPSVVYVGYTPGYHNCYVYGGTVVYGTGYTYAVWVGAVYYPRPVTYGYARVYYPGVGRWFSPYSVGGVVRRTRRRTRRRHRYHHNHHSYHRNRSSYNRGNAAGNRADAKRDKLDRKTDRKSDQFDRKTDRKKDQANRKTDNKKNQADRKTNQKKNNHYADKSGNVHRRNDNGSWDKQGKSGWSGSDKRTSSSMEKSHSSRDRGSSRTKDYNKSRSSSSKRSSGRSGGGRSGGGGRRR